MKKTYFRSLWYALSANQRYLVRRLYYFPLDILDRIQGKKYPYVPSRGSIFTGLPSNPRSFLAHGEHQLDLLQNTIDLKQDDTVLDIGSGIGRTAISLSGYLNSNGKYEGFDVVKKGVDWCNSKIRKDYSNFNFTYIPLFNDLYNNAHLKAENFVFPYKSEYFDKIFSFSVFTHMQIDEIQNYFGEINRVLKNNGLAFSTFFLYNDQDEEQIATKPEFRFSIKKNGYRLMNNKVKSGNIAIHKDTLQNMLNKENLSIVKIIDGFWKGNIKTKEYQDVVIFKKNKS